MLELGEYHITDNLYHFYIEAGDEDDAGVCLFRAWPLTTTEVVRMARGGADEFGKVGGPWADSPEQAIIALVDQWLEEESKDGGAS